jgi:hypothetical protein
MTDLSEVLQLAESNLNESRRHLAELNNEAAREFVELKLQSCIFQYDVCAETVNVVRNQPSGFAGCVALKGLVLRLFEYSLLLNRDFIPKLIALATKRGIDLDSAAIRKARKQWKVELQRLEAWADVRNEAAGHYTRDVNRQVLLLESLSQDAVMDVARAFLSFNMLLLQALRSAGLSSAAHPSN